jgi:hypothetical protein
VPQSSVAVAVPATGIDEGLQPKSEPAGQEVNTGAVLSAILITTQHVTCPWSQVMVRHNVSLPQPEPAVYVTDEPEEGLGMLPVPPAPCVMPQL